MRGIKGCVAAIALAVSAQAAADTITVDWKSPVFNPASIDVGTVTFPGGTTGTNAGRFHGAVTATVGVDPARLVSSAADFFAYCHDLSQTLGGGATYTVSYGAPTVMLDFLGAVNSVLGGGPFAWLLPGSSTIAAAVQLGIWEALFSDDFVLHTGSVRVNLASVPNAVETQYAAFVAAMGAGSADLSASLVMVLTSGTKQDVITGIKPGDLIVPEPGTLALFGFAAVAAALIRRRRNA